MLPKPLLHAVVPTLWHAARPGVPGGEDHRGAGVKLCQQRTRTLSADAHIGSGRPVDGFAVGAQQAWPRDSGHRLARASPNSMSRCTCTDISIPKPIITVIIAEPPCDTSGNGTPPTGIAPITMAMLTNT